MDFVITPEFRVAIGEKRLESLNQHPSSVYGLDANLNIAYLNPAWFQFAAENGGNQFNPDLWSLNRNIFDCIPNVLESFYRDLFESTLYEKESPLIAKQASYECSSPELFRLFSMHLYAIGSVGIIAINSLSVEETQTPNLPAKGNAFDASNYIDENGLLIQCANCRRVQRLDNPEQWDWIPKFIEQKHSHTSHGVCRPCMEHYYMADLDKSAQTKPTFPVNSS